MGNKKAKTPLEERLSENQKAFFGETYRILQDINAFGTTAEGNTKEKFAAKMFSCAGAQNEKYTVIKEQSAYEKQRGGNTPSKNSVLHHIVDGSNFVPKSVFAIPEQFKMEGIKQFFSEQIDKNRARVTGLKAFQPEDQLVKAFGIKTDTPDLEALCEALALAFKDICCCHPKRMTEVNPDAWGRPAAKYYEVIANCVDDDACPESSASIPAGATEINNLQDSIEERIGRALDDPAVLGYFSGLTGVLITPKEAETLKKEHSGSESN